MTRTAIVVAAALAVLALPAGCADAPPTAGGPAPVFPGPTASGTPAPGPTAYLSDLRQLPSFHGNEFRSGVIGVIGGRDFPRSLSTRFCRDHWQVALYNLRRPYSRVLATVGLGDGSDPSAAVRFTISADDTVVFEDEAGGGRSVAVDASIRDSGILTLSATLLSAPSSCRAVAVWGDARVVG